MMNSIGKMMVVVTILLFASPIILTAAVTPYSQDFESLSLPGPPGTLLGDGWLVYANVYDGGGNYLYGYGPFDAPNDGAAFCAVVSGEGGPSQGNRQLSVFSDYNNGDHGTGNLIESIVYQEQTIDGADVGMTWTFTFDAKLGNLEGSSEAEGFIKTLDPDNGYATTNYFVIDTTNLPTTWGTYFVQITIDGSLVDQLIQFGFTTRASNYEGSGVIYDNVVFQEQQPPAAITLGKTSTFNLGAHDHDGSGTLTAGDTLLYTVVAANNDPDDALGIVVLDTPDPNTTLTVGTVTTTQGTVTSGNTAGDPTVAVDVGTLSGDSTVTVEFEVTLNDPLPVDVTEITNQAVLQGPNIDDVPSNSTSDAIGVPLNQQPIPTLGSWGFILLSMFLGGVAVLRLRRS